MILNDTVSQAIKQGMLAFNWAMNTVPAWRHLVYASKCRRLSSASVPKSRRDRYVDPGTVNVGALSTVFSEGARWAGVHKI